MHRKTLLVYVDVFERFGFFAKCVKELGMQGYDVWIATARYSVVRAARKISGNVLILRQTADLRTAVPPAAYDKSLSVLNGYHSRTEAETIGKSVWAVLDAFHRANPLDMVWIWNGTTTIARTFGTFAAQKGIRSRYFELSNLGERIFVDPEGTSGASYLAKCPEILDTVSADDTEFDAWKREYRANYAQPKQAANRSKLPWRTLYDLVGYRMGYLEEDRRNPIRLIWQRLRNKAVQAHWPAADLSVPYLFLPLQVSDDSQVKLYSCYSNTDMIQQALKLCREKGLGLIVKIHPAESDHKAIEAIVGLEKVHGFRIAGNPTPELIDNAAVIAVNNSTVGLEAMIAGKEVEVFGNAYYRRFDRHRLKAYVLRYLLPADYFGDKPVPSTTIEKILAEEWWTLKELS